MTDSPNEVDDGRGALRTAARTLDPPVELEDRIRKSLSARGRLRKPSLPTAWWVTRAGLIAAGIIIGALLQHTWTRGSGRPATQPGQYVLLLLGETPGDTGAVHVARAREYGQWASSLHGASWVGGHELGDVVEEIGPKLASAPVDRIAGYFVIDAPSAENAAEVARTCPHLKYGGRVVVMTIVS